MSDAAKIPDDKDPTIKSRLPWWSCLFLNYTRNHRSQKGHLSFVIYIQMNDDDDEDGA